MKVDRARDQIVQTRLASGLATELRGQRHESGKIGLKFTTSAVFFLLLASAFSMLLISVCTLPNNTYLNNNCGTHLSYSGVPPPYYEVIATVTSMVDGDTTWVRIENIVVELDPDGEVYEGNQEQVRYGGGIDAPETYMEGGPESTEFIENLIPVGTTVYLDLDNYAVGGSTGRPYRGKYERLIAVIYAVIDNQWVNINAELLRWGMEEYPYHDWDKYKYIYSEFDCYDWPPYDNDYPYVLGFSVPNEPPTSSVNAITPYWQTSVPFTITTTASDPDGFVENVTLWYRYSSDNENWAAPWTSYGTDTSSPWEWSFDPPLGDGHYKFYSIAVDNSGEQESKTPSSEAECGVDTNAPTSSVNAISPYWQTSPFSIFVTASDEMSGVENVSLYYRYSRDNSSWGDWALYGTDTGEPWSLLFTAPSGDGHYEFYSVAGDKAGNAESAPAGADAGCGVGDIMLGTPVKISPANGAKTNDNILTFEWTLGASADNHRLLVDNDPDFSSPEDNVLLGATDNMWTKFAPGYPDENYSWKVVTINVTGEKESTVWMFLLDTVPPGVPAKSAPADGTSTADNTPIFSWTTTTDESSGIAVYEIWIDGDPDFSSPEALDNTADDTTTTYTPPELADGTYSWRVRAWDRAGNGGDFEAPWTFSVYTITRGISVSISPPEDNAAPGENLTFTVTVTNTGEVADDYDLTVSDDAGWGATLDDNLLEDLAPGENGVTTVSITIPAGALENMWTNITVRATSGADLSVWVENTCKAMAGARPPSPPGVPIVAIAAGGAAVGGGITIAVLLKKGIIYSSFRFRFQACVRAPALGALVALQPRNIF